MNEFDPFEEAGAVPEETAPTFEPETTSGGPTLEAAETAPVTFVPRSRENFDPFEEMDRMNKAVARAVSEGDSQKAARLREMSKNFSISRLEAEDYYEELDKRQQREMAQVVLEQAPGVADFLNGVPADAPIFKNDLKSMSVIENLFGGFPQGYQATVNPYQDAPFDPYGSQREEPLLMDESTGNPALDVENAGRRNGWEVLFHGDIKRGFDAGVATTRQGALWDAAARGEVDRYSQEFRDQNAAYDAEIERATKAGSDGWIFNAAQFAGSAVGSAPEGLPAATMGAATAVAAAAVGAAVGAPVALTTAGLIGIASTLGWYDASSRVEGGLSYKSLIEAGTGERNALLISRGVGNLNAAIETGLTMVGAKLAQPFAQRFAARFVPKLGEKLTETTLGNQFLQVAKAWGLGSFSETATEVLQEAVTMAGEELARVTSDANFDPATLDDVIDRLSDTAINAFKGAVVLGGIGAAGGMATATAKVHRAQESKAFFEELANQVSTMESMQTAPDAVHEFIERQAGSETKTTYIDGVQFAQAMIDAGVSREELTQKMPDVAAQLDDAVATGTDVEIPTADYATKIAATDLGKRLVDHVRLAPDALSVADAVRVERAYRDAQKAIVRGTFDPSQAGTAERFINSVENREWAEARKDVEEKLFGEIKSANPKFTDAEARGQAKLGAIAASLLARRAGVPVTQMAQWAPSVSGGENGQALRQIDKFEMQRRSYQFDRELEKWRNGDGDATFDLGSPSWVLQLFGVSPEAPISASREQFVHVLFPKEARQRLGEKVLEGKHNLSADELKGILVGIQQPLAVFESGKSRKKMRAIVVLTELQRKGADGNDRNLIVPIRLTVRKGGQELVLNDVLSVYEKERFGEDWFAEGRLLGYEKAKGLEAVLRLRGSISSTVDSSRPASSGTAPAPVAGSFALPNKAIVFENETSVGDLYQSERGYFSPSTNVITLTPNADLTTFSHELGHWYLSNLLELSKLDGTSESLQEDAQAILKEFGLESVEAWDALGLEGQRKYHERFAYWTEIYFATGKAPVSSLQKFFNRLGAWIRDAYRLMKGEAEGALGRAYEAEFGEALPQLSPEVRRVLDRMIASEDLLDQATAAESLKPLFDEKPDDMTDEQWFEMRLARDDAEMEGIQRLNEVRAKDEKWMASARSKELRKIQAKAKEIREEVRKQVEIDVNSRPEFVALDLVSRGNRAAVTINLRMDPESVAELGYSKNTIAKLKAMGCLKKGGLTPQQAAEAIKPFARTLRTGKKLVDAIIRAGNKNETIERETTQRCLEKYSDYFDAKKVDALVTKAIHNEARSRLVANELRYLLSDPTGRSRIYREAARRVAADRLSAMKVGKVNVRGFMAAEGRASREAYDAIRKGDRARAIAAKQRQLVCHEMVSLALEAEAKVRGLKKLKAQIFSSDKKLAKTRDIDIINVARYVLTNSGAGKGSADQLEPEKASGYVEKLQAYEPEKAAGFQNILDQYRYRPGLKWTDLSVGEAYDVIETVRGLWNMAGDAKQVMIGENSERIEDVVDKLVAQSSSTKTKSYEAGTHRRTMADQKLSKHLLGTLNRLRRFENWCIDIDGGQPGVFHRYLFAPVANAAAEFRNANNRYQKALAKIVEERSDWMQPTEIHYAYGDYTFTTKAELMGAILHTGNPSNKAKLLVGGRGDGHRWCRVGQGPDGKELFDFSPWDNFFNGLIENGTITKEDMDAVQAIWDLLEDTKPLAQRAYKKLWGYYFTEIEAQPIKTKFGEYRGGYVPAVVDSYLVAQGDTNLEKEILAQNDVLSAMPAKRPGFSKSRSEEYRRPLNFNLAMLSSHVQKVLKFAYIAPAAQEVAKVVENRKFTEEVNRFDPTAIPDLIRPWLKRATEQTISDGQVDWISKSANKLRSLAGMNIMAGHVVNALQQATGLSVAVPIVGEKNLRSAFVQLARGRSSTIAEMCERSAFMRARLTDRSYEYQSAIERAASGEGLEVKKVDGALNKLVAFDSKLEPARDWIGRHAYFFQTAIQFPIDTIVWTAAYNKAIADGMTDADAAAFGDSVVRTTQSDFSPENIANIEAGSALLRLFLVFYNYFGMQANLLGNRWTLAKETKNYGRLATDALCIVWIPSVLSGIIQRTFKGGFDTDDDDDVDFFDMFQLLVGEPLKNVISMVPLAGSALNTAGSWAAKSGMTSAQLVYGKNPYTGRIMSSPGIDLIGNGAATLLDLYKFVDGRGDEVNARNAARHFLDLASIITRLPLGAIRNPVGYSAGVAAGQYDAGDPGTVLEGLLTGKQE